jgi:hypothetical protein
MVTQEVIESLYAGQTSHDEAPKLNINEITKVVFATLGRQQNDGGFDDTELTESSYQLHDSFGDLDFECGSVEQVKKSARMDQSGHSRGSRSNSEGGGYSMVSELSMKTGQPEENLDIFHPDFWNADIYECEAYESSSKGTDTKSHADSEFDDRSQAASTEDFIKSFNEVSDSESSESEDELSIVSDLSGLTGVFTECPEGRRVRHQDSVMDFSTEKTVTSNRSGRSSRNSLVGSSIGGSAASSFKTKVRGKDDSTKSVQFDEVHLRHYERIMCDNPASTNGPSIGIGWKYVNRRPLKVDEYELRRPSRRSPSKMVLNRPMREKIIRKLGYSEKEMATVVRELNKARFQRRQTVNNLGAAKVEEAVEAAKSRVKSLLFLKLKKIDAQEEAARLEI